jgi:hypothetical protein
MNALNVFMINLNTAKAIGIEILQISLSRALGRLIRPAHTENDSLLCDRNVGEGPQLSLV